MPLLALKIDVDTWLGTRDGVPRLLSLLQRHRAPATFLFSLGPDHTGRAIRRVFRPGFLSKVRRTSVTAHYGLRTLLYGTLLPGPRIGERCRDLLREVAAAGFEVGVHAYDHVKWQDGVAAASREWTRRELILACDVFTDVFGAAPRVHGAAGWQVNRFLPALEYELGFTLASDTRGFGPFAPLDAMQGRVVPQLPTTLPTLDELLGRDDLVAADPVATLLALTARAAPMGHVYTLHAELEGGRLGAEFESLLTGWREQGYVLTSLSGLGATLAARSLPQCRIAQGRVDGRSGELATQVAA